MSHRFPLLYVVRHSDTAWTDSRQHTGRTDIPLNERGEARARQLADRLKGMTFAKVFTSPLVRAAHTCELAGFGAHAEKDSDLMEWDYGRFEGKLTADIVKESPGWDLFRDGAPDGESPDGISKRADRFLAKFRQLGGDALLFAHGHISRVLAARWLELPASGGGLLFCAPGSIGVLGYEHNLKEPVIRLWNDRGTLEVG